MLTLYRPGKGAIVKYGDYWYPVRLILRNPGDNNNAPSWRVQWWRGCQFLAVVPDDRSFVSENDIVDELWYDREGRRSIRVSRFVL